MDWLPVNSIDNLSTINLSWNETIEHISNSVQCVYKSKYTCFHSDSHHTKVMSEWEIKETLGAAMVSYVHISTGELKPDC